jgi:hypothetical protein
MFDINDAAQNDIWDDETGETVGEAMARFKTFGMLINATEARRITGQEGHPTVMSFGYGEDPVDFDEVTSDDFEGVTDQEADSMWGPFAVWENV